MYGKIITPFNCNFMFHLKRFIPWAKHTLQCTLIRGENRNLFCWFTGAELKFFLPLYIFFFIHFIIFFFSLNLSSRAFLCKGKNNTKFSHFLVHHAHNFTHRQHIIQYQVFFSCCYFIYKKEIINMYKKKGEKSV